MRSAIASAGLWEELASEWLVLDAEREAKKQARENRKKKGSGTREP